MKNTLPPRVTVRTSVSIGAASRFRGQAFGPTFRFVTNRVFLLTWAFTLMWVPTAVFSQPPATDSLRDDVLEWIDQLEAPERARRQEAEKKLIDAGRGALDHIPADSPDMSAEAKERLGRVRRTLQMQKTKSELAEITVDLQDIESLADALEAISRDTGVEFDFSGDRSIPIDQVATPLKFWHAVDLVLDQANLDINFYGGDRETLMLVPRQEDRPDRVSSGAYTGVYRLEPTSVTARRVLNQPSLNGLNISMEIAWEPRVTPIGLTIPIQQISVELQNGGRLSPQSSGESIDVAANSDVAFSEFFLPMKLPGSRARVVKRLSGVIEAMLPGKRQKFELDLAGESTSKSIDAMTVSIEGVRLNGELHEVRVGVELKNADRSLESHRQWIFDNEVFVVASDGTRLDHLGYQVYRQTSSGVGIGYLFDLSENLAGQKLIYRSPTAVVKNQVPFVIQDIELP
ncbi:MAG: hypothetical protein AAF989_00540 [Planctomycetota bacterium]